MIVKENCSNCKFLNAPNSFNTVGMCCNCELGPNIANNFKPIKIKKANWVAYSPKGKLIVTKKKYSDIEAATAEYVQKIFSTEEEFDGLN